jgi:hypothetical protein
LTICGTLACTRSDPRSDPKDGREACVAAGGRCVIGGFDNCLQRGSYDCNPSQNPGGAFCCLEEPAACTTPQGAALIKASNYDQSCQTDADCVAIGEGDACVACTIECKSAAIRRDALADYQDDIEKLGPTIDPRIRVECNCLEVKGPCCVEGECRADEHCE